MYESTLDAHVFPSMMNNLKTGQDDKFTLYTSRINFKSPHGDVVRVACYVVLYSQVQPDLNVLDTSMDDDGASSDAEKKSVENLGKLHYKLEYDFQKGEVSTK